MRAQDQSRRQKRRRRDRGALLGIVLILLVIVAAASAFTVWSMGTNQGGARNDRLSRQLLDCAEQGLAFGKQWFSASQQRQQWDQFLSTNVCNVSGSMLPCGPFPTGATGTAPANYPASAPYTQTIQTTNGTQLTWQIGIYNPPESVTPTPNCSQVPADPLCLYHDGDYTVVLYARCQATATGESRSAQVLLNVQPAQNPCGYKGQQGFGCNNGNNMN
jgi:Tfp pilus assembly protein PilX